MGELTTRRRIYEEILLNPGLHFRELQSRLNMPTGVVEYHLGVLEKEGIVVSKMDGRYRRLYPNTAMTRYERKIMGILRSKIGRRIVIFLIENGRTRHGDLAKNMDISPSTLSYHLSKLIKGGIIGREISGRERYYFVINEDLVAKVIIKYRRSFLDVLVDNFAEWYLSR